MVPRKATNLSLVVYDAAFLVMVLPSWGRQIRPRCQCDSCKRMSMRHPSAVLLVPLLVGITGALLQEGVGDLVVNMLLQHVRSVRS